MKENSQESHILHDSSDVMRCLEKANLWRQRVEEWFWRPKEETAVPTCGHEVFFLDDGNVKIRWLQNSVNLLKMNELYN